MLIGAEGPEILENAIAFPSCGVGFKDADSTSCGRTGQGRPRTALKRRGLPGMPADAHFLSANQKASLTQPFIKKIQFLFFFITI
jgi:hypothetical protein